VSSVGVKKQFVFKDGFATIARTNSCLSRSASSCNRCTSHSLQARYRRLTVLDEQTGSVVGASGTGKTGALIVLLEEAARNGVPTLIVDVCCSILAFQHIKRQSRLRQVRKRSCLQTQR
jgi:hypothetical protein